MQLTFLAADGAPLVKEFALDSTGALTKSSYPNAFFFTSYPEDCPDLPHLVALLRAHGNHGHCLLKGNTGRPLVSESRAGSTNPDALTDWVCLDLDGAPYPNPDAFMQAVGLTGVSYVLQWSASSGIDPNKTGLHCHLFARLATPTSPARLKLWLQHLNLTVPGLRSAMELTRTQNACHWPLDVTTCQNDKLLYIAPPKLGPGLTDPFVNGRVTLIKHPLDAFVLPANVPSQTVVRALIDTRVNELREAAGIPKKKASVYKTAGVVEYLARPDTAVVTGIKEERGFTYLNLNDGDSWGYFHPSDNPEFIYNFKGEPAYKAEELVPEYYRSAQQAVRAADPKIYLAFRDFHTGTYHNGWYDEEADELNLARAQGRQQLFDFMKQHGHDLGDSVPDWYMKFDPHDPVCLDLRQRVVNTYQVSPIMKAPLRHISACPPACARIINSVLGGNAEVVEHFHNWMGFIFQFRQLTYTAWVFQGVQGTGKGILANKILMPIFGKLMTMKRMEQLEENFTGDLENKFLIFVDEVQVSAARKGGLLSAKLKNMIGENNVASRQMYSEARTIKNYTNFIFASNMPDPVEIPPDDRRYNVGDYQTQKLAPPSAAELKAIEDELHDLYCYWMSLQVDEERAHTVMRTQARQEIIDTSMQAADVVAGALLKGDIKFFVEQLPTDDPVVSINTIPSLSARDTLTAAYREIVRGWVLRNETKISRDQLMTVFRYCVGENISTSPHKFATYLKHHKIHLQPIWINQKTVRGATVAWVSDPAWLATAQKELA